MGTSLNKVDIWREMVQNDPVHALRSLLSADANWTRSIKSNLGEIRGVVFNEILDTWRQVAKDQPKAALLLLDKLNPKERKALQENIAHTWDEYAKASPEEAINFLRFFRESEIKRFTERPGEVWVRASAILDFAAMPHLPYLPAAERLRVRPEIQKAWHRLADDKPREALTAFRYFNSAERSPLRDRVISLWDQCAKVDPVAALKGIENYDDVRRLLSPSVLNLWKKVAETNPSVAILMLPDLLPRERAVISHEVAEVYRKELASDPTTVLGGVRGFSRKKSAFSQRRSKRPGAVAPGLCRKSL